MDDNSLISEFQLICDESPSGGLHEVDRFVEEARVADPSAVPEIYRLASFAARLLNRPIRAGQLSKLALESAQTPETLLHRPAAGMTHAYNLFLVGEAEEAVALISSLDAGDDHAMTARIRFQHATILARIGNVDEADSLFRRAGQGARNVGDAALQARVEKNRGMLAAQGGDHRRATEHLTEALRLFESLDIGYEVAFAKHALAVAATKMGNLPDAFRYFNESESAVRDLAGSDFESKRDRCEALTIAGLFTEAAEVAEEAAARCDEAGLVADAAEIRLMAASARLDAGRFDLARSNARSARAAFERQGRLPWASAAELIGYEADFNVGRRVTIADLVGAIETVETAQLDRETIKAKLLLARIQLTVSGANEALRTVDELRPAAAAASLDLTLAAHLTSALCRREQNEPAKALEESRRGFDVLRTIQAQMGSPLLRSGVSQHARELGQIALGIALNRKEPVEAWLWIERIAVSASTPRPITPPADDKAVSARRQLRSVDAAADARVELENVVRDADLASEEVAGVGMTEELTSPPSLPTTTVLSYGVADDLLYCCRLDDGEVEVVAVQKLSEIAKMLRALHADQRRLALSPERAKPERIVTQIERLDDLLVPPMSDGDGAVVVVPPPELFSLPWTALPSLRTRPSSVTSSLTSWLAKPEPGVLGSRLFVAGPNLQSSQPEIDMISNANDLVLVGEEASVDAVLSGMEGVDVAHLVAHGTTKAENPLFSSLLFADGRLNVYELGGLADPPKLVVLSACNVGTTSSAAATTMLGMVTALLHTGAGCVLASPIPVSDSVRLSNLMAEFHTECKTASGPAQAWAAVQRSADTSIKLADASTFCIYGRA